MIYATEEKVYLFTKSVIQLNLKTGMLLLSIRSSNIAFTMGATGPLLERADNYEGEIKIY